MMQKINIFNPKATLNIHYASQETESERVTWAMAELTPMKKDLDALLLHDTHVITPECSKSCKLIEMDPNSESLFLISPVKSGEILLFVEDIKEASIHLYVIPKLGIEVKAANPIKTFKRGCDLIAVDEAARLVSFYDRKMSRVSVFRFDDTFRHFDWCGVDLLLSEYAGGKSLTSMMFVPGKREMVLVDSACKVWVFEVSQPGAGGFLKMEVYLLDETMSHLKTISLDYSIRNIESLDFGTVSFGSQAHLVLLDRSRPDRGICSEIVQISSASEVCRIQTVKKTRELTTAIVQNKQSCPALEYIHLIFEKYATCPPLMQQGRKLTVQLVLGDGPLHKRYQFKDKSVGYLTSAIDRLQRDKGKDFSGLKLKIRCDCVESCIADDVLLGSTEVGTTVTAGDWLCLLVCLVPIQIARAENNSLRPMIVDGLEMPASLNYADAVGLAEALRFGFYDAVLAQWPGPIKVISSMGKQSSGKSYLLNHLSGSLLDVAGGRCTDGVWMTMRASKSTNCLYVLLDFKGLGSFERSELEDMLLSILNAAVSNITIFNKKDFHLDKETEAVFERFQNGVSLVKQDSRLFKGLFYMAIKDVDTSDVEDLKAEFYSKIQQICSKSQDNFLTRMYGGEVEIAAMPPFHRPEYHESVADIAGTVEELHPFHQTGSSLAVDLKLVIAQISARDWSPIDSKRIALKLDLLRKHLSTAIDLGRLMSPTDNVLVNFETQQEIADLSIVVDGYSFDLSDTGLELSPSQESRAVGDIFQALKNHFQISHKRSGPDDELWHSTFEKFLVALADRRRARILEWLSCNTCDFQDDGDVQNLRLETVATLAELTQRLSLCSSKCKTCFLRCVLEKSHPADSSHNCQGTHFCNETCTFCAAEEQAGSGVLNECGDLSGHEGPHDCGTKSHTCGKDCSFVENSSNCNVSCALKTGHEGEHRCNTKQHLCDKKCSVSGCKNSCVITLDAGDHDKHLCHERMCPMTCRMLGCTRKCGSDDHFHSLTSEAHFCGNEHICKGVCQAVGICQVVTEVVRKSKTFTGKRSVFEYEHVSEQNGVQKQCCIPIPPWMERHAGDHCHTVNANAVHFCTTKCAACGYFCNLPIGHPGLHDTAHGNMRDVRFVAEAEDIDLADRKYSWGESGLAEMCMMHCTAQGRGHIHLIKCNAQQPNRACAEGLLEGSRHQTQEYGPDKTVPKDELSHAAFWKHMRFKDPCQEDVQKQFELCNHQCRSADHEPATGSTNAAQERSYCTEKLWHAPVSRTELGSSSGYVTEDGHSFSCNHVKNAANYVVFIVDRSGSMAGGDVKPALAKFYSSHENRLGCVYEAILRFIRTRLASGQPDVVSVILFDNTGSIAFERQLIAENIVDPLLQYHPSGGTTYSSGLNLAQQVLQRAFQDPSLQGKHPAIIFLSDGGNNGGTDPIAIINKMQDLDHRLVFHTILFGRDYVDQEILKRMAAAGNGTYQVSIDEVQLARSFEGLAKSLRPKVAALM